MRPVCVVRCCTDRGRSVLWMMDGWCTRGQVRAALSRSLLTLLDFVRDERRCASDERINNFKVTRVRRLTNDCLASSLLLRELFLLASRSTSSLEQQVPLNFYLYLHDVMNMWRILCKKVCQDPVKDYKGTLNEITWCISHYIRCDISSWNE